MPTELFSLNGKTALITGATGGIGSHFSRGFAAAGADVVLTSRTEDKLATLACELEATSGVRAKYVPCDLGDMDQVRTLSERAWSAFGKIDVILHNAVPRGGGRSGSLLDSPEEAWTQNFNVILWACLELCKSLAPKMAEAGGGSIVTVISSTGINPTPGLVAYGMAKGSLLLLTKYMAKEWGPNKIRANALNPGSVASPGQEEQMWQMTEQLGIADRISMRRVGRQDEVVGTAIFLASDAASYISGQLINIDGGRL